MSDRLYRVWHQYPESGRLQDMSPCDLYLTLPPETDVTKMRLHLPGLLSHPRVTALRLSAGAATDSKILNEIIALSRAHDVATILSVEEPSIVKRAISSGIDGLHVQDITALDGLRALAGDEVQLGCLCETRDDAMLAGERGADYIAFPAAHPELVTWWTAVMELPAVAEGINTPEEARTAQDSGADFLAIPLSLTEQDATRLDLLIRATEP